MKLYNASISAIVNIIIGENNNNKLYRRGWHGVSNYCQNSGIKVLMEYQHGESRDNFLSNALKKINGTNDLEKAILHLLDREYFLSDNIKLEDTLTALNLVLEKNDYKVIGSNWNYKIILINENHIKLNQIPEDFKHLKEFQDEAYKEIEEGKYWEVVTKSRTIIEITLKEISNRFNLNYEGKDIVRDLNAVKTFFKMDAKNQDYPDYIKGLISATSSIVNNIAEARNKDSTAHAPRYKLEKHHAKFILESAISLSNFLISVMEYNTSNNKGR